MLKKRDWCDDQSGCLKVEGIRLSENLKKLKYLVLDDCCMIYVPSAYKHLLK